MVFFLFRLGRIFFRVKFSSFLFLHGFFNLNFTFYTATFLQENPPDEPFATLPIVHEVPLHAGPSNSSKRAAPASYVALASAVVQGSLANVSSDVTGLSP